MMRINIKERVMQIFNSFQEMAAGTGAASEMNVFNGIPQIDSLSGAAGNPSLRQGRDEQQTREKGREAQRRQLKKEKPLKTDAEIDAEIEQANTSFKQMLADELKKDNVN